MSLLFQLIKYIFLLSSVGLDLEVPYDKVTTIGQDRENIRSYLLVFSKWFWNAVKIHLHDF